METLVRAGRIDDHMRVMSKAGGLQSGNNELMHNHMKTVTDFLKYIGYEYPDDRNRDDNPLWVLGIPPFSPETYLYIQHQFLTLVRNSNWDEQDKDIWTQTYVLGESPESIAEELGMTPDGVLERFQACSERLPDMVRAWWEERLEDNPEVRMPELLHEYITYMIANLEDNEDVDADWE